MSVPISLRMTKAVPSAMPSMVVRATPARRERGVRASQRGSWGFVLAGGPWGGQGAAFPEIAKGARRRCDLLIAVGGLLGESSHRTRLLVGRHTGVRRARDPATPGRWCPHRGGSADGAAGLRRCGARSPARRAVSMAMPGTPVSSLDVLGCACDASVLRPCAYAAYGGRHR